MFVAASTPKDTDAFWLFLVIGIILFLILVTMIFFDNAGRPRRWIPKRWRRHSSER